MAATTYKIAHDPGDYEDAHELLRAEGVDLKGYQLEWPTVLAYEEEECVGLISCYIENDLVVCGPLTLRSDIRRPVTALRLCERFEEALSGIGINSYIIRTDGESIITEAIPRYTPEMKPYAKEGDSYFYVRKIGNGRTQG